MARRNHGSLVLVVDDEEPIRAVVREVLADVGYDVAAAANGEEALGLCQQADPDLILLDLNMPRLDGRSFLERYRREQPGGARVVVVSAGAEAERTAREIGADGFLAKPFGVNDLAEIVRRQIAA